MKFKLHPLWACAAAGLLCACAATSLKQTWKSPDSRGAVGKIAVLAVEDRGLVRQAVENRFVAQLARAGAPALVTFDLLTLPEIKQDKAASAQRLRAGGAEALIVMRLVDSATSYREIRPGRERFAATATGFDSMTWYDCVSVGFTDLSPTYGSLQQRLYLETSLYDLKTEKRLWSGLTKTVVKEEMDRLAEADTLIEKIVAAMRQDAVIP